MKRRRDERRLCAECGQPLARVQLRPPAYACGACEPLRPMRRLAEWEIDFERLWEVLAHALAHPVGLHTRQRPPWCFTSSGEVLCALVNAYGLDPATQGYYMVEATAMLAWRAAKAVYRVHPALLQELLDTPIGGALPVEALLRLPVWAPYVECDLPVTWGCSPERHRIRGFYALLDHAPGMLELPILRLLLDVEDLDDPQIDPVSCCFVQLALEPGLTVEAACERVDHHMGEALDRIERTHGPDAVARRMFDELSLGKDLPPGFVRTIKQLLSVLLYLCAENVEADRRAAPLPTVRTLAGPKGPRLVEPPALQVIRCGLHAGEQLRRAREEHERHRSEHRGGTVAPHVRAAHWHHFWRGPRDGARELVVRWLAPIFVRMGEGDAPPATTVRAVT